MKMKVFLPLYCLLYCAATDLAQATSMTLCAGDSCQTEISCWLKRSSSACSSFCTSYIAGYISSVRNLQDRTPILLWDISAYGASASPPCPQPCFADLLLKIEKRPIPPEPAHFRGDFGRFYLIWGLYSGREYNLSLTMEKPSMCCFGAIEKRRISTTLFYCLENRAKKLPFNY